jgi:hypothetical protein
MEWRELASCKGADTNIFFEESRIEEAKEFCDQCVVRDECLDDAIWSRSMGTWAGTTQRQRMTIRGNSRKYATGRVVPVTMMWR